MKIFGDLMSGNCLKVKYTADFLRLPHEWVPVNILQNESRTQEFLQRNQQGQVPVLQLDDGRYLAQSNAIIRYLSRDSKLLPSDPYLQAKVDEYMFWEQYSHEPYIAVCRFHMHYLQKTKQTREPWRVERGENALDLMEQQLQEHTRKWFVADSISVADIALLAYTRVAPEGGFDLSTRPAVQEWISRCETALKL